MSDSATPSPKKGPSGLAIAGMGCGALFIVACIGGGLLAAKGCSKFKEMAGEFQKNPSKAAAVLMVKANPELELVGTDDAKGEITIKNKKTGEVTTMGFDELGQGKFTVKDAEGNVTTVDGSAGSQGQVTVKGKNGEMVIGGAPSAVSVPAWVPQYPGATPKESGVRMENNGVVSGMSVFESADSVTKVKEFYESKLKAGGFKVDMNVITTGEGETAMVSGTKEDSKQKANAVINLQDGKTAITLNYEGPK